MTSDCYAAEFISVTNENDLAKLRGSKYLQAKVGIAFKKHKKMIYCQARLFYLPEQDAKLMV